MADPSLFRGKRRHPRLALVSGALIAVSMAVACGPQPSIPAADPNPIHLGLGLESLSGLAFIAEAQDFFTGEGLVVQTHRYPSGRLALKGLLAGEVEIATAAQTPVTFAAPQHPDLRILAVVGSSDNEMKLVGRRDHGINSGADLRGKTLATQPASSMHFFTHLYLLRHRVGADAVSLLFRPPDQLAGLLTRGEVDAIASREPLSSQVRDSLGANAIVLSDRGLYVKMYLLVCRAEFLKRRPTV
ncbi:ABC transporter substrate-binding protein, partial [bacterium]|nr:ABC transporter substrate-binding protein [bacterium]